MSQDQYNLDHLQERSYNAGVKLNHPVIQMLEDQEIHPEEELSNRERYMLLLQILPIP